MSQLGLILLKQQILLDQISPKASAMLVDNSSTTMRSSRPLPRKN